MSRLAVLGAGSWGTALAIALAPRFERISLWARDPEKALELARMRENERYLPGFRLPEQVAVTNDIAAALESSTLVLSVIPSCYLRSVWQPFANSLRPGTAVVSATKGIEPGSLLRMSQVLRELVPLTNPVAVLSGPSFAREIAAGEPAALVIAAEESALSERVQIAFATSALRFYASTDVVGVEIGAALKNVIAIGAGICGGLGLGSNSVAALVTRGLAEIGRLALAMGAQERTLSGLAGLGDLVLTATGHLSRNRAVGIKLGLGQPLHEVVNESRMIAEGVPTCEAAHQLGLLHKVDLPIINNMYEVLYQGKDPKDAIRSLMERPLTSE